MISPFEITAHPDLNSTIMNLQKKAFTLIELLVVLALIALLGAMLLPALASSATNSQKMTCLNNLKWVGLAFRSWEGSHGGRYPMAVSASSGGAWDWLSHSGASATPTAPTGGVLCPGMAFMVMSNELSTPKVLHCPSDNVHTMNSGYATNFSYGDLLGIATPSGVSSKPTTQVGELASAASKISYFINGDATEANPQNVMTGDDNIGNTYSGTATASAPASYRFGASVNANTCNQAANGVTSVGITSVAYGGAAFWSWTANDFHRQSGNLGMADGSCQSATTSGLHYYLNQSTNSVPAEAVNFMP